MKFVQDWLMQSICGQIFLVFVGAYQIFGWNYVSLLFLPGRTSLGTRWLPGFTRGPLVQGGMKTITTARYSHDFVELCTNQGRGRVRSLLPLPGCTKYRVISRTVLYRILRTYSQDWFGINTKHGRAKIRANFNHLKAWHELHFSKSFCVHQSN